MKPTNNNNNSQHHVIIRSNSSCDPPKSSVSTLPTKFSNAPNRLSATLQSISRRGALMVSCEDLSISGSGDQPMGSSGPSATASHEGSLKSHKRSPLSRSRSGGIFSNPFRNDHDKMEQLTEILNQYSLTGIPEQNAILTMKRRPGEDSDDELFYLEEHWRHIVAHADHLDKKVQSQQDAIWELIETEVFYIKRLRVVTDLFLACLCNLQNECLLNDTDIDKMFSNIQQVYEANHQFWLNYLLPMLNSSRSSQLPLNPILMKDGFLKFDQLFYPYIKYCLEHSSCLQYVKEKHKESELFKAYVVWCETRKDCERLRLMDLLVKPMQRLTKYSLLLKAILRKTDSEFDATALKRMNESVEQFVLAVDASLRQRHEEEKLACVVSRIESYDVIDCGLGEEIEKVGKDYCRVDFLTRPMIGCRSHQIRKLVLEGSGLKLKESPSSSKMDVHCLLFTDLLLVCKATGRKNLDRVRIIRQPYLVERLVPIELKDSSSFALLYVNELKVASALLTVYSPDARTWLDHIRRAQELYSEAKQRANQSPSSLGRSVADSERDLYGHIAPKALLSAYSPRSSRSSFCHSYSGSVDQTSDLGSVLGSSLGLNIPPAPTPASVGAVTTTTSNLLGTQPPCGGHPCRARSFELGDLRNPSLTGHVDWEACRSHSMENRTNVTVMLTSPRPERRAFLLKGSKGSSLGRSPCASCNTLNVPGGEPPHPQPLQVPVLPPPASAAKPVPPKVPPRPNRNSAPPGGNPPPVPPPPVTFEKCPPPSGSASATKPPLVKMKNIHGLMVQPRTPSSGETRYVSEML